MSKSQKKTRKGKDKVSPVECSELRNDSISNGKPEKFQGQTSDSSKIKADIVTSSETSHKNADKREINPKPAESNTEDVSQLKNTCNALKSNLNAIKKKYDTEKEESEKLSKENQSLKSQLSTLQEELEAAKMELEKLKKESVHPMEVDSVHPMEVDEKLDAAWKEPVQNECHESRCEDKERSFVQHNTRGGGTKRQNRRESDTQQKHNERPRHQAQYRSSQYRGNRNHDYRPNTSEHYRPPLESQRERRFDHGGDHRQNWNCNEDHHRRNEPTLRTSDEPPVVSEISGDLFSAPQDCSLAHCVAEDMRTGSGLAVTFSEGKEHNLVQNNGEGTREELRCTMKQVFEMKERWDEDESDTEPAVECARGSDQDNYGNLNKMEPNQMSEANVWGAQAGAAGSDECTGTETSSQTVDYRAALQAPGGGTRRPNRRESDTKPKHNERPHHQGQFRSVQHHGNHNDYNRPNRLEHCRPHQERCRERRFDDEGYHHQNLNRNEDNRRGNEPRMRTSDELPIVTEIFGDLFNAPQDFSLAHCVAEDMRMGSGIAVTFRQMFKRVDELLGQRKQQGQVAVLEHEGRYIYYLVTKPESTGKPTMETLEKSLVAMCDHVIKNNVKKIAMPRIGCGLDRLKWFQVRPLIEKIFSKAGTQIVIYNYNEEVAESSKSKPTSNIWVKNAEYPVAYIEKGTAILCLCAADGSTNSTLTLLDQKFKIMAQFEKMEKKLGSFFPISMEHYCIILLIVKETNSSPLSFTALGESIRQACKLIDKQKYYYVALEAFDDKDDPLLFQKVISVVKSCLDTKCEKELWLCWPKTVSRNDNTRQNSETKCSFK